MKIDKNALKEALTIVKPGLAQQEIIDQSTSFCFLKDRVVTYNDEISISSPVKDLAIKGAVNADELYLFLTKIKVKEIDLEIADTELLLKAGRARVGLRLHTKIKLPFKEIGEIDKWKKLPKDFLTALRFAMGSCSTDMSRPVLTCVFVNKNVLESTDNYRLVNYSLEKKVPVKPFLIPAKSCGKVIALNPIEIAEGEGWIHFRTENDSIISCRIFEDDYPDTSVHFKIKGKKIIFPESITTILDKAVIFSKRADITEESVQIKLGKNQIEIKSESDTGNFSEKTKADYKGDIINFHITPYLLKDILKNTMSAELADGKLMFSTDDWKYVTLLRE